MSAQPTHLYRLWNANGELLYIGISKSALRRLTQHQRDKSWANEIASVTVEVVPTRADAERMEAEAIRSERPKHNVIHRRAFNAVEVANEAWASASEAERAEALTTLSKMAVAFGRIARNDRDRRLAGMLAMVAVNQDPQGSGIDWSPLAGGAS